MSSIDLIVVFCACNDVTHKAERNGRLLLVRARKFLQEREVRTWLFVIATGQCLLAKDRDTLIEQSLL